MRQRILFIVVSIVASIFSSFLFNILADVLSCLDFLRIATLLFLLSFPIYIVLLLVGDKVENKNVKKAAAWFSLIYAIIMMNGVLTAIVRFGDTPLARIHHVDWGLFILTTCEAALFFMLAASLFVEET